MKILKIAIIGWSHGGMIALLAATRHPDTFNAVGNTGLFAGTSRPGPSGRRRVWR